MPIEAGKPTRFTVSDYNDFQQHYKDESDRSAALLASSFLENCLEQLIREKLANHPIKDGLFRGFGPLATFSARSDIALLLGLIPEHIYSDLKIIRKIRNEFAHTPRPLSFGEGQIKDLAANLIPAKGIQRSDGTMRTMAGGRSQFFSAVTWILIHIETQRERISPLEILQLRFEEVVDEKKA
jgi:DNA-binding MltR family transcriptional regulator